MSSDGGRRRGGGGEGGKAQYYVWYLGWKECRAMAGREFTEPVVKDLVMRRRGGQPVKLTIEVSASELNIHQVTRTKYGRTEKVKFPAVALKDVTYAAQGLAPDEDVVACIYLGYNSMTRRTLHVHVYRFDSPSTAAAFAGHLNDVMKRPGHGERLRLVEEQLMARGEVTPRPGSLGSSSYDARAGVVTDDPTEAASYDDDDDDDDGDDDDDDDPFLEEKEDKMESLAAELKQRLSSKSHAPILLPPQDYDTVRRVRGNLTDYSEYKARKCKNESIVGQIGAAAAADEDVDDGDGGDDATRDAAVERESKGRRHPEKTGRQDGRGQDGGEMANVGRSPPSPRTSKCRLSRAVSLEAGGHAPLGSRASTSPRSGRSSSPRSYGASPDQSRRRSGSRGSRGSQSAPFVVPPAAGKLPPPGFACPPPDGQTTEAPSAAEAPEKKPKEKEKTKKKKKKGGQYEEPPPDYTLRPSDRARLGF